MPRRGLPPDLALDIHLSALCSRHQFTNDPGPVLAELRAIAGARHDILARVAGQWASHYRTTHTAALADALLDVPGARSWADQTRR